MSPALSIAFASAAVVATGATIVRGGSKAYREIAVPRAASGLAMIYEEAAALARDAGETLPVGGDHQTIARALENFGDGSRNYLDLAKRKLKKRDALILATRADPPEPGMQFGPLVSLDDLWGTPFTFAFGDGGHLTATSAGPDRRHGTGDDVGSAAARKRQKLPHPSSPERAGD